MIEIPVTFGIVCISSLVAYRWRLSAESKYSEAWRIEMGANQKKLEEATHGLEARLKTIETKLAYGR